MWIVILVAVVAVLLILYIKFYNRLQRLSVKVQEGSVNCTPFVDFLVQLLGCSSMHRSS